MTHASDWTEEGFWVLQHHDATFGLPDRRQMVAGRIGAAVGDNITPAAGTLGDIQGGMLWVEASAGDRDYLHSWFMTGAPAVNVDGAAGDGIPGGTISSDPVSWLPTLDANLTVDSRYVGKVIPAAPSWWDGVWPVGWTAEIGVGTEEYSQEEIYHPDFWGLVAVNRAGNPKAGTQVFDLDTDGAPDRHAHLQSILSLLTLDVETDNGLPVGTFLALQLGPARIEETPGGLLMVDHEHGEIGCGRVDQGGPFTTGRTFCQHSNLGDDEDGNDVQPLHLAAGDGDPCGTMWLFPDVGDGPMLFDSAPYEAVTEPSGDDDWREVVLRFDSERAHSLGGNSYTGVWAWQVNVGGAGGAGAGAGYMTGIPHDGVSAGTSGTFECGDFGKVVTATVNGSGSQLYAYDLGAALSGGYGTYHEFTKANFDPGAGDPAILTYHKFHSAKPLPASFVGVGAGGLRIRMALVIDTGAEVALAVFVHDPDDWTNANPDTGPPDYSGSTAIQNHHGPFNYTTYDDTTTPYAWFDFQIDQADLAGIWSAGDVPAFTLVAYQVTYPGAGSNVWRLGGVTMDLTG
jgi:hypothetical protein